MLIAGKHLGKAVSRHTGHFNPINGYLAILDLLTKPVLVYIDML
jgi:hypothetical protein